MGALETIDKLSGPGTLAAVVGAAKGAVRWLRKLDGRLAEIETTLEGHDGRIVDVTDRESGHHTDNIKALDRLTDRIDALIDRREASSG